MGGNLWRPGHSSCSYGFVKACDAEGVMLIQPSGDGEGSFAPDNLNNPTIKPIVKKEIWRDVIVRDRNNPSILAWEASNADIDIAFAADLRSMKDTLDSLAPRRISVRSGPGYVAGDLLGCTRTSCEIGNHRNHPLMPAWGSEAWGLQTARFTYGHEIEFAAEFLKNWHDSWTAKCFGLCQWYLAETPGEVGNFLEMKAGEETRQPRSFGSSMMDFNRIPKLLYYAYKAAWRPYSLEPVVAIANHWNRSGTVRVNVFSNCPKVRLLVNGKNMAEKAPNSKDGVGTMNDLSETTTQLPFQCSFDNVAWQTGTVRAEGLDASGTVVCFDEKKTAGAPDHVQLTVDPHVVKPNGEVFQFQANGTDAATILATIVDANGNWCPTAGNLVTFSVSGPGNYRGGTDQFVDSTKPLTYHSPLDPELQAEGGMCKVAVRTTFIPGVVTVTAKAAGLGNGQTTFTVNQLGSPVAVVRGWNAGRTAVPCAPTFKVGVFGTSVQYFTGKAANVSIDVLSASGKLLTRVADAKQAEGWHPVKLNPGAGVNGVYILRCVVDGKALVKRVIMIR